MVNGGDRGAGLWLMGFIYIYKIIMKPLVFALNGAGRGLWEGELVEAI
jgi:hypothetical protein